ncbi:MAG: DctP family TRAP transporter solute-binding subunit [bacterium]
MIKKTFWSFILLLFVSSAAIAKDAKYKVKFAHGGPPKALESPVHATAVGFKYMLEKRSGGQFEVEIYPSNTLGNEIDHMEAIQNNVIQVYMATAAGFHRTFPPALLLFTPYLFRNADIAMEVIEGPFGDKLKAEFEKKTGLKMLTVAGSYTYMAITNNKRPIRKPEDLKGLKMRVMDPMGITMFKSLGASATPIAWPEVYTSLQTGVVDGQTNPTFIVAWAKFNEVQKYMTLANSQWGYQLLLANKQWYESLSAAEKIQVRDATTAARYSGAGMTLLLDEMATNDLIKKGMQVEILSESEIKVFQDIAGPACMAWVRKALGNEWADALVSAIDEAETKLGYK